LEAKVLAQPSIQDLQAGSGRQHQAGSGAPERAGKEIRQGGRMGPASLLLLLDCGCAVPPAVDAPPALPTLDGCRTLMAAPMRGQHLLQMCPSLPQVRTSS
jgi:hypothetical protein